MSNIKVSIITVVLNAEKTIERTIQSVIGQSYQNIEYLIIDGNSTDGTLEIIKKYEGSLKLISRKDNGMYEAMNRGISMAAGRLVGMINADDWYEPDTVKCVVDSFLLNPSVGVLHGLLRTWNLTGVTESVYGNRHTHLKKGMIEHPTCFVSKELYEKIGLYDTKYRSAADYEFMLRAVKEKSSFLFIEHILANFQLGGISASFTGARETLCIQREYGLISLTKQYLLLSFFWLKLKL